MSATQWAPWVSVFLGGCLSGAALLSLTSERAADAQRVVTVSPPPSTPNEPPDPDEASEHQEAVEPDAAASQPGDVDPTELVESEQGPSAADVLAALEQAYQRQVAAAEAPPVPTEPAVAEADNTDVEAEVVPPPAVPPPALAAAPDEREAEIETEPETAAAPAYAEPVQVATAARADQPASVQQIAVVYQPVYVLPPAANPTGQGGTPSSRRSVGRDPWAPFTISPRHNPWSTTAASGGAWGTVGVAGGVWAAGFTPRP